MLGTADMINEVAKSLKKYKVAVTVVDPVCTALMSDVESLLYPYMFRSWFLQPEQSFYQRQLCPTSAIRFFRLQPF